MEITNVLKDLHCVINPLYGCYFSLPIQLPTSLRPCSHSELSKRCVFVQKTRQRLGVNTAIYFTFQPSTVKRSKTPIRWHFRRFRKPPLSLPHSIILKRQGFVFKCLYSCQRFQMYAFSTKTMSVSYPISVDGKRIRIKKYASSNIKALV